MEFILLFIGCIFAKKLLEGEWSTRDLYITADPTPVEFDPDVVAYEKDLRRRAGL